MTYEMFLERVTPWAEAREDIRLVMIIGSRARMNVPSDEWSDLDLVIVTKRPELYIESAEWLQELAEPKLTFLEGTAVGELVERRVLFEGGLDVDFIPLPYEMVAGGWPKGITASGVLGRGYWVLVDKEGLGADIPRGMVAEKGQRMPSEAEFSQIVNDFLYHVVWAAKKLGRGELWMGKMACDSGLKWHLLKMIEWHTHLSRPEVDTWHSGRFLDTWAETDVLTELQTAYARYDLQEVWSALIVTQRLFSRLAQTCADIMDYYYPLSGDEYVIELIGAYQKQKEARLDKTDVLD
ncbi:aminoglycoside 6-adenylyltransferase [Tumebacillus avium]|nr:aminoglycoside 6-adenylyltransferase [Tumebacillus avium]